MQISVIVPAFNEADNLPALYTALTSVLSRYESYEIIIVDDGSFDGTANLLGCLSTADPRLRYICFSRNFGHQKALRAGLEYSSGACVISLDADLQHPPEVIHQLIEKWREGFEVVTTVRSDVDSNSWMKKITSRLFYGFINRIGDCRIEPGSADFRLIDRVVVEHLRQFQESELFLRGILPWLGFKTAIVPYTPGSRLRGKSKYRVGKMMSLAATAVLAHSVHPLRLAMVLALVIASLTGLYGIYAIVVYFTVQKVVPGWASIVMAVSFLGALQLLVLGIIGEYVGRVLREVLGRPHYIIRDTNMGARSSPEGAAETHRSAPEALRQHRARL